jgi:hypothetical protein
MLLIVAWLSVGASISFPTSGKTRRAMHIFDSVRGHSGAHHITIFTEETSVAFSMNRRPHSLVSQEDRDEHFGNQYHCTKSQL